MFTYSVGNMVFMHASDPAVVRDVCLSVSPDDLGKSSYMKVTHHPLFGDGILKSNGDAWARQRKLIAPEFFPDKVKVPHHRSVHHFTSHALQTALPMPTKHHHVMSCHRLAFPRAWWI